MAEPIMMEQNRNLHPGRRYARFEHQSGKLHVDLFGDGAIIAETATETIVIRAETVQRIVQRLHLGG